jgi:hypothetical protein
MLFVADVRYWPLADMGSCTAHVCFRGGLLVFAVKPYR